MMTLPPFSYDYDYVANDSETNNNPFIDNSLPGELNVTEKKVPLKYMYAVLYSMVFLLGVSLNILVICMTCKMKKTTSTIWFLGLAVTDFIFCLFLPFAIIYALYDFNWVFGLIMCKLNSYVMFISMFSTALILTLLSIDRCFSAIADGCVRKCCTALTATNMVWATWFASAILSTPSLALRDIANKSGKTVCYDNYGSGFLNINTVEGEIRVKTVIATRFIFGIVLPLFIICLGSCLVSFLKNSYRFKSSRTYRIVRVMIFLYFLCWAPYHVFMLMALNAPTYMHKIFAYGLPITTVLAVANSCINPIVYIFMGSDLKMSWMEDAFLTGVQDSGEEKSAEEMKPLKKNDTEAQK
ncbi:chemerin-like receptor 1 [Lepisosteus oculatus]|uniref:chemerin-like receptor 1 n=1 Tax=Lepisosteus oculatus TaxID=7918 RepID=UPI0035F5197F